MKLKWINVDLPDEPRWGQRDTEQTDEQGRPLFTITCRYPYSIAQWWVGRGSGEWIDRDCPTLAYAKSVAQDRCDHPEAYPAVRPVTAAVCEAKRATRDGECNGPVAFAAVYRAQRTGEILSTTPGCFRHVLAEVDRALAAGTIARVDMEELP